MDMNEHQTPALTVGGLRTLAQAQEFLGGISRTNLWQLIRAGEIPVVKIGRRRFIAQADLAAFIEKHRA